MLKRVQRPVEVIGVEVTSSGMNLERNTGTLDRSSLAQFLDAHFDGVQGLLAEFPLLARAALDGHGFVFRDATRGYVAHAAWKPLLLVTRSERIRAAGIGLVTTHLEFRGRGLASELVRLCIQRAQSEGCTHALLFSTPRSLYTSLGFAASGSERVTRPNLESIASCAGRARRGRSTDVPRLLELLCTQPLRVERSADEFRELLQIPDTHVFVWERDGRIDAYCVEGKGRDLSGYVHEWAGAPELLPGLFACVAEALGGPPLVLSPASEPAPVRGEHTLQHLALVCRLGEKSDATKENVGADAGVGKALIPDFYIWGLDSV